MSSNSRGRLQSAAACAGRQSSNIPNLVPVFVNGWMPAVAFNLGRAAVIFQSELRTFSTRVVCRKHQNLRMADASNDRLGASCERILGEPFGTATLAIHPPVAIG